MLVEVGQIKDDRARASDNEWERVHDELVLVVTGQERTRGEDGQCVCDVRQ